MAVVTGIGSGCEITMLQPLDCNMACIETPKDGELLNGLSYRPPSNRSGDRKIASPDVTGEKWSPPDVSIVP